MPETQPRPEHPRPQFQRNTWLNLNGTYNFAIDSGKSGEAKGWPQNPAELDCAITVPFCPESSLSGIQNTDFMPSVWYHRTLDIPDEWTDKRVLLHFGAVDYHCKAWVNGRLIGQHYGGSSSFTFDITDALTSGANHLVVCANDDTRSGDQPSGKQCPDLYSRGCHYTRITGIWQTVWLEAVPESRIETVRIVPDLDSSRFVLTPTFKNAHRGHSFRAVLLNGKEEVAVSTMPATSGAAMSLRIKNPQPWSPDNPHLYDLRFELRDNDTTIDTANSYAGLRKFHIEGHKFYLNNTPLFLRLVLDQGFYPDGIWTAPSDEMLKGDIEKSLAVGFNGARLHQKVFEERFHYWADKLGYLTWGEYCDWGMNFGSPQSIHNQQREWREIVQRDLNHPSILAWTPYNETRRGATNHFEAHRRAVQETYDLTRVLDPSRPCHDTSGYVHVCTDIYTVHDYEQDPVKFQATYAAVSPDDWENTPIRFPELNVPYQGQPYVVDEYGGTWWDPNAVETEQDADRKSSWGYGKRPTDIEEVYHRIEKLTAILLNHPNIAGYCYTQLTDIEQEQNGIYTYDRREKFDAKRLKKYFGAPAAIEEE
ncbi:MAG: beta-glucuronidase [Gemmatimonadetes bacterium]|nr:beta-glucuronidase [Gemmatimonadota bacterium]MYB59553.1 beta-glucuronidase [Gemmatimonadota bacterium]